MKYIYKIYSCLKNKQERYKNKKDFDTLLFQIDDNIDDDDGYEK